jgi:uncharacterized protein (DUF302 family)
MIAAVAALVLIVTSNDQAEDLPDRDGPGVSASLSMNDISYSQTSSKPFDVLVASIEAAAAAHKFTVLQKHNIHKSLAKKGFDLTPYTIIEVCNAKFAHTILSNTKEAGMFLPCRIAVYEDGDVRRVIMMKPSLIRTMMPERDFGAIPEDVEQILINVIKEAV